MPAIYSPASAANPVGLIQWTDLSKLTSTRPANQVLRSGDAGGAPAWASLTPADIPVLTLSKISDAGTALAAKLNTTGGTLTGALVGTGATFSGTVTAAAATYSPPSDSASTLRINNSAGAAVLRFGTYPGFNTYAGFWAGTATPDGSNYNFLANGSTETIFNSPSGSLIYRIGHVTKLTIDATTATFAGAVSTTGLTTAQGGLSTGSGGSSVAYYSINAGNNGFVGPAIANTNGQTLQINSQPHNVARNQVEVAKATFTQSSGVFGAHAILPTINQTGTAGYTLLSAYATETSVGTGTKRLISLGVGSTESFGVSNDPVMFLKNVAAEPLLAYSGGVQIYAFAGALRMKGGSGNTTTIGGA